jgi:hypothetical protein
MTYKTAKIPIPVDSEDKHIYAVETHADGPQCKLPLDAEYLRNVTSGDLFGLTEDAGMGWSPALLRQLEFLVLSTVGGIRAPDAKPIVWVTTPVIGRQMRLFVLQHMSLLLITPSLSLRL